MEKKSAKWQCKLCGERQSLKQVFARGSGPECRKAVQELNLKRMEVGRLEEQKLEAVVLQEEEEREMDRIAECMEKEEQHLFSLGGEAEIVVEEGCRLEKSQERQRPPLTQLQVSASGSRWEKFMPAVTSEEEDEEDDLEETQGWDLRGGKRLAPCEDQIDHQHLGDEDNDVASKRRKVLSGGKKASGANVGNAFSSTGNVFSKWGKFSK